MEVEEIVQILAEPNDTLERFLQEFIYAHPALYPYADTIRTFSTQQKYDFIFGAMEEVPPQFTDPLQQRALLVIMGNFKMYGPLFEQILGNPAFYICCPIIKNFWFRTEEIVPAIQNDSDFEELCQKHNINGETKEALGRLFRIIRSTINEKFQSSKILTTIKKLFDICKSSCPQLAQRAYKCLHIMASAGSALRFATQNLNLQSGIVKTMIDTLSSAKTYIQNCISTEVLSNLSNLPQRLLGAGQYTSELFHSFQNQLQLFERFTSNSPIFDNVLTRSVSQIGIVRCLISTMHTFTSTQVIHREIMSLKETFIPEKVQEIEEIKKELAAYTRDKIQSFAPIDIINFKDHIIAIGDRLKIILLSLTKNLNKVQEDKKALQSKRNQAMVASIATITLSLFIPGLGSTMKAVGLAGGVAGLTYCGYNLYMAEQLELIRKALNECLVEVRQCFEMKQEVLMQMRDAIEEDLNKSVFRDYWPVLE